MRQLSYIITTLFILISCADNIYAQDEADALNAAEQYLDSRTASLDKYLRQSGRIQNRLLNKLSRKEDRILRRLAAKDSALYHQYLDRTPSFDSIATLHRDSTFLAKNAKKKNSLVDSLKGIQSFMQAQAGKLNNAAALADKTGTGDYGQKLEALQQKLNAQQQVKDMVQQRSNALQNMASTEKIGGLKGIQKNVYYAQEKIKNWKELADEPEDAEAMAMEYLQGTEDFNSYLNKGEKAYGGLGNNATAEDLQRMGYQTKKQVSDMLQKQLGDNLGAVQQKMGAQIQEYTDKLGAVTNKVKEAKAKVAEVKQTVQEIKEVRDKVKNIEKPAFRKNPERGKPFWQRLEKQYNFRTTRATTGGLRPAMLELGASLAFKHTSKLSYGLGIGAYMGMGKDWQHIKFSYEGISGRLYADWLWQYGVSAQAGYEQIFRPSGRAYLPENKSIENNNNNNNNNNPESGITIKDAFGGQQRTAYIGLMKRYRISSKWNGTFLVGYDFLWREEGLRTPFILRLGWGK